VVVQEVTVTADEVPEAVAAMAAEPVATGENAESRERLIVAAPAPEATVELEEPMTPPHTPSQEEAKVPPPPPSEVDVVLEEPVEEAPISSRRALVAEPQERLAEMAFGAEEPAPRHTPPPESGRLPAVPTEDGGNEVTGVRDVREAASLPIVPIAARPAEAPEPPAPVALTPEKIDAHLPAGDAASQVIAEAQSFAPPTFAALLEASLSL
jgi:hypothetical protein